METDMPINFSYTRELENLITEYLLPVYDRYYREQGVLPPYANFPKGILKDVTKPRRVCALCLPDPT